MNLIAKKRARHWVDSVSVKKFMVQKGLTITTVTHSHSKVMWWTSLGNAIHSPSIINIYWQSHDQLKSQSKLKSLKRNLFITFSPYQISLGNTVIPMPANRHNQLCGILDRFHSTQRHANVIQHNLYVWESPMTHQFNSSRRISHWNSKKLIKLITNFMLNNSCPIDFRDGH